MLSRVWLFATPWAVACQAPLSMGFSMQEIPEWVAISFSQGIFLTQGWNPCFLCLLHWWADSSPLLPPGKQSLRLLPLMVSHCLWVLNPGFWPRIVWLWHLAGSNIHVRSVRVVMFQRAENLLFSFWVKLGPHYSGESLPDKHFHNIHSNNIYICQLLPFKMLLPIW